MVVAAAAQPLQSRVEHAGHAVRKGHGPKRAPSSPPPPESQGCWGADRGGVRLRCAQPQRGSRKPPRKAAHARNYNAAPSARLALFGSAIGGALAVPCCFWLRSNYVWPFRGPFRGLARPDPWQLFQVLAVFCCQLAASPAKPCCRVPVVRRCPSKGPRPFAVQIWMLIRLIRR